MSDFSFDFIDDLQLEEVSAASGGARFGGVDKNPDNADIRLFSDGKVYPSKDLVSEFQLEYQKKDGNIPEFGFDVFNSMHWGQYQTAKKHYKAKTGKEMPEMLIISPVSKHAGKVSLFSSTTYNKDKSPKASVINQGASTFGKELIEMINELEGEDIFADGKIFVDLRIERSNPLPATRNGIYNIPKTVSRGKDAGKYTYTRRENTKYFPLVVIKPKSSDIGGQNHLQDQLDAQAEHGGDFSDEPLLRTTSDI